MPRPGPAQAHFFSPRPCPGLQNVGPDPAWPEKLSKTAGRTGLGPKVRSVQGTNNWGHWYSTCCTRVHMNARVEQVKLVPLYRCMYFHVFIIDVRDGK